MKIANFFVKFTLVCMLKTNQQAKNPHKKTQTKLYNKTPKKLLFLFSYMVLALLGMQTQVASSSAADLCLLEWGISKSGCRSKSTAFLFSSFELGWFPLGWYD